MMPFCRQKQQLPIPDSKVAVLPHYPILCWNKILAVSLWEYPALALHTHNLVSQPHINGMVCHNLDWLKVEQFACLSLGDEMLSQPHLSNSAGQIDFSVQQLTLRI